MSEQENVQQGQDNGQNDDIISREDFEKVKSMKDSAVAELNDLKDTIKELKQFKTDTEAAKAEAERQALEEKGNWEELHNNDKAKWEEREQDLLSQINQYKTRDANAKIDLELSNQLDIVKVDPLVKTVVQTALRQDLQIADDGTVRTKDQKQLGDFVTEWSQTEAAKRFILDPGNSGGNSHSGAGGEGGPGKPKTLTEAQDQLKQGIITADQFKSYSQDIMNSKQGVFQ